MRKLLIEWIIAGGITIGILLLFTSMQEDAPSTPRYEPIATQAVEPEAEAIEIVFIDDIPTAVAKYPTLTPVPTPTETVTPTPTELPATPTEKPQERVSTPKPTNTPKPEKKAQIVAYPTGKVGTQYVDEPEEHAWKPYARHTAITNKSSVEYKLVQMERTASNGLRVVTDPNGVERYCIALEPQWAGGQSVDIWRCIDIKMANGATLHCVLADVKRHEHSWNKEGRYGSKNELIEFIAEQNKLPEKVRKCGDVSYCGAEFEGGAVSITVLDLYIEGFGH